MKHRISWPQAAGHSRLAVVACALAFTAACGGDGGGGTGGPPTGPTVSPILSAASATTFSGAPGYALDDSVAVRVTNSNNGAVLANTSVSFEVTGGGGSVSPATVTTDAQGIARARWTLGAQEGAQAIRATLPATSSAAPVSFSATAAWGPEAALSLASGADKQATAAGCGLLSPLAFKVVDAGGAPVPNASVYLTALGGGKAPVKVTADAQGVAQVPWTLDAAGAHTLQASLRSRTEAKVEVSATAVPAAPGGYAAAGPTIVDTKTCKPHRWVGLARSGLESWPTGDDRLYSPTLAREDFKNIRSWGSNIVRIPLNASYWVKTAGSHSPGYPEMVDSVIARATSQGLDVVIDMHFSDRGDPANKGYKLERHADANHGIQFWKEVANRYKNNGRILFELYNEPHDISWSTWLNGGPSGDGFITAGYQALYDAVRSTGAQNLVIVNGLNWGYDLSQAGNYMINGYNVIYGSHVYDWPEKQPGRWDQDFGYLAAKVPVMIGEFGTTNCGTSYYQWVMEYADQKNIHWIGWAWYAPPANRPDLTCSFAALLSSWDGTPSPMGAVVKAHMAKYPR